MPPPDANRLVLREVNRLLFDRARNVLGSGRHGARFRSALQTEEGVELASLETYDHQESADHIDFSRVPVPWAMVPTALLNGDLHVRRYEATVEHEFVVVLDLSRSMAFPHAAVYAGTAAAGVDDLVAGKAGRLKLIAGAFLRAALESGFLARLVVVDEDGVRMGSVLRRPDLSAALLDPIDRHLSAAARRDGAGKARYDRAARDLMAHKGCFLFVGDFLDGAAAWPDPAARREAFRVLELFREWARRRPLGVVRVNDWGEVQPPHTVDRGARLDYPLGQLPKGAPVKRSWHRAEQDSEVHRRLAAQQAWEAVFVPALRSAARGFLAVHTRTEFGRIAEHARRMWSDLVGP
jgi:hypothetical protein